MQLSKPILLIPRSNSFFQDTSLLAKKIPPKDLILVDDFDDVPAATKTKTGTKNVIKPGPPLSPNENKYSPPTSLNEHSKEFVAILSQENKTDLETKVLSEECAVETGLSCMYIETNELLLDLLDYNKKLSSEHIATYFELLEKNCGIPCLSYFFVYGLCNQSKNSKPKAQDKIKQQVEKNQGFVLVPINESNFHWILVVADVSEHTLFVYDSLSQSRTEFPGYLELVDMLNNGKQSPWPIVYQPSTKQTGIDCGVFVCVNARLFAAGCASFIIPTDQSKDFGYQMRYRLCHDIIYHDTWKFVPPSEIPRIRQIDTPQKASVSHATAVVTSSSSSPVKKRKRAETTKQDVCSNTSALEQDVDSEKDEIKQLGREIIELDEKLLAQETGTVFGNTHPLTGNKGKQHYVDAKKRENKLKELVSKLDKTCQLDVASEIKPTYYEFVYKPETKHDDVEVEDSAETTLLNLRNAQAKQAVWKAEEEARNQAQTEAKVYIVSVKYLGRPNKEFKFKEPYAALYSSGELFHHTYSDFLQAKKNIDPNMKKYLKYVREHVGQRVHMHGAQKAEILHDLTQVQTEPAGLWYARNQEAGAFCAMHALGNLIDITKIKAECLRIGGMAGLADVIKLLADMTTRRKQFEPKMVYNCRKKAPLPDFGSEIGMFVICSSTHHCFSLHDGWLLDTDDSHPNAVPWSCRHQIGLDGIELAYQIARIKRASRAEIRAKAVKRLQATTDLDEQIML